MYFGGKKAALRQIHAAPIFKFDKHTISSHIKIQPYHDYSCSTSVCCRAKQSYMQLKSSIILHMSHFSSSSVRKALLRCQRLFFTSWRGVKLRVECVFSFIVSRLVNVVIFGKKASAKTIIINVILVQHMAFCFLAVDISNHSPNSDILWKTALGCFKCSLFNLSYICVCFWSIFNPSESIIKLCSGGS